MGGKCTKNFQLSLLLRFPFLPIFPEGLTLGARSSSLIENVASKCPEWKNGGETKASVGPGKPGTQEP